MSGIYSRPAEHWPKPENAIRALRGERPLCWNRPDFPAWVEVQDGWEPVTLATPEGMTATVFAPTYTLARNDMSKGCKAWAVHPDENPAVESIPAREGWRCHGCRHLPNDPRVIERAQQAEGA